MITADYALCIRQRLTEDAHEVLPFSNLTLQYLVTLLEGGTLRDVYLHRLLVHRVHNSAKPLEILVRQILRSYHPQRRGHHILDIVEKVEVPREREQGRT